MHYPSSDLLDKRSHLTQQLDLLGQELRLRMQEAGVSGGRKVRRVARLQQRRSSA